MVWCARAAGGSPWVSLGPTRRPLVVAARAQSLLHIFVTLSMCFNFVCVAMVTFVTVWGGGKVPLSTS